MSKKLCEGRKPGTGYGRKLPLAVLPVIAAASSSLTQAQMAACFGVSRGTIFKGLRLFRLKPELCGLPPCLRHKLNVDVIAELLGQGLTCQEVADRVGVKREAIRSLARRRGIPMLPPGRRKQK